MASLFDRNLFQRSDPLKLHSFLRGFSIFYIHIYTSCTSNCPDRLGLDCFYWPNLAVDGHCNVTMPNSKSGTERSGNVPVASELVKGLGHEHRMELKIRAIVTLSCDLLLQNDGKLRLHGSLENHKFINRAVTTVLRQMERHCACNEKQKSFEARYRPGSVGRRRLQIFTCHNKLCETLFPCLCMISDLLNHKTTRLSASLRIK